MKSRILFILLLSLPFTSLLSSCATMVVGAAVTTVDIVHSRRSAGAYIDDAAIELKAREFIIRDPELRKNAHVSVTSMNGIVLLSGETPTVELRNRVGAKAKNVQSVRQVVNEIRIAGKTAFFSRANDTWLTGKVKTRLFQYTSLDATRVKVVSEYGNVYLMGIVTRAEAKAATDVVRGVNGVVRVVKVFEYTD